MIAIIFCLIAVMAMTMDVHAEDEKSEQRTVRVAFPAQGNMGEIGEGGDLTGYNYNYLQKIAEYAGWKIEYITFEDMSADEGIMKAMEMVMNGEADLIGPILDGEQVREMFEFPQNEYGVVYTTLCALEKSDITSVNFQHIKPLRVAVYEKAAQRNAEVTDYLELLGIAYELVPCDTTAAQLEALHEDRADVLSSITLSFFDGTRAVAQFAPRPYYLVSTPGNQELMQELDHAIEMLDYAEPYIQEQLQEEFFGDTSGDNILTDDEQRYMDGCESLHVLCASDYAPYCSAASKGEPAGMLISLFNDFAKSNQIAIDYKVCEEINELEKEWESGKYDCLIGVPLSSEYCAQNKIIQTSSVISTEVVIFGKPQTDKKMEDSTVAVFERLAGQVNLSNYAKVIEYPSIEACYKAVEDGTADYGCANRLSADYQIFDRHSTFVTNPLFGEELNLSIGVSKSMDYHFISVLNKYIHALPDATKTGYLSEATRHVEHQGINNFIHTQPVLAIVFFTIIGVLIISSVMLAVNVGKNKKRNLELERANSAKTDFLSRMSHDIRTPMNAILGFAELGQQDVEDPEKLKEDLQRITSSGQFLLGLVNDILDMTKIENKAMELQPEPYSRNEFEEQIRALIIPLCAAKNQQFDMILTDDVPKCVLTDKLRFNQIFFNLLSNAVKFTDENGKIELQVENLEEKTTEEGVCSVVRFIISDNGIGMSEEFQKSMFEVFSQEHQHISGKEGTGLGLPIVKSLVTLMNGTIEVESKIGAGSKFIIELPLTHCEIPKKEEGPKKAARYQALENKNILLCEDHPINTRLACRLLEKVGANVTCASNGQEGVNIFMESREGYFAAVLMDIRMPIMDGLKAAKKIRNLQRGDAAAIPIIAMTANAFDDDRRETKEAGMNEHLSKPIAPEKLYQVLIEYV
ncbi:extracellular solute-binding protein, family 3 [Hespellia stercorisuis DSM 15480]|uniref:Stage 0 sporulation protein A homolog n=2 Tax=Hespellia stercorisuis TaxID=180311 RepID=A0A1M6TGU2_9FIRM|nr:extracellular solute-binding protein, family 3 [Hespellia stercorisuis DSM 15480]